jgi:hypothetical protein
MIIDMYRILLKKTDKDELDRLTKLL